MFLLDDQTFTQVMYQELYIHRNSLCCLKETSLKKCTVMAMYWQENISHVYLSFNQFLLLSVLFRRPFHGVYPPPPIKRGGTFFQKIFFMGGGEGGTNFVEENFLRRGLFYMGGLMIKSYQRGIRVSQNVFSSNLNTLDLKNLTNHCGIFT